MAKRPRAIARRNERYDPGDDDFRRCAVCHQWFDARRFTGGETSLATYTTTGSVYDPPLASITSYVEDSYVEESYAEGRHPGELYRSWTQVDKEVVGQTANQHASHWFCFTPRPFDGRRTW